MSPNTRGILGNPFISQRNQLGRLSQIGRTNSYRKDSKVNPPYQRGTLTKVYPAIEKLTDCRI